MAARTVLRVVVALAPLLLLSACGSGGEPAADPDEPRSGVTAEGGVPDEEHDGLEVVDPRATLLPGVGAVYFTVINHGPADDRLLAVTTPAAAGAMIHRTVEEEGVMRMEEHGGGYPVPAGGRLELVPGGRHVMLHGPTVEEGPVPLLLRFERAGEIAVEAPVVAPGEAVRAGSSPG